MLRKTHLICVSSGQADGDAKSPTLCVTVENTETGDKFSKVPHVVASGHSFHLNPSLVFIDCMMMRRRFFVETWRRSFQRSCALVATSRSLPTWSFCSSSASVPSASGLALLWVPTR